MPARMRRTNCGTQPCGYESRDGGDARRNKPFAGKTLNAVMFDHPYPRALKQMLPQFTDLTGIKVELDTPRFIVHNQRPDLELST
jgi:hypothetical protein